MCEQTNGPLIDTGAYYCEKNKERTTLECMNMVAKLVRKLFLSIVMGFLVCLPVEAREGLSPRQQEIWQTVMSVDGYLTR